MTTQTSPWTVGRYQSPLWGMRHLDPQPFADAKHAKNFGRYLFSATESHPATERTALNPIATFDGTGQLAALRHNTDPNREAKAWVGKVEGRDDLAEKWMMDIAYIAFLFPDPDAPGTFYSNFVEGCLEDGTLHLDNEATLEILLNASPLNGNANWIEGLILSHLGTEARVLPFEEASEAIRAEIFRRALRTIARADLRRFDISGDLRTVLAVGHHDQDAPFHIHRIIWQP